jgi:hypothetical protein
LVCQARRKWRRSISGKPDDQESGKVASCETRQNPKVAGVWGNAWLGKVISRAFLHRDTDIKTSLHLVNNLRAYLQVNDTPSLVSKFDSRSVAAREQVERLKMDAEET